MPLDERQRLLLQHVARYRLTTVEATRTVAVLRLKTNATAREFLQNLVRGGWLGEAPLDQHGPYFYLTERAAQVLGLAPQRTGPLSETAKVRAFALLAFCRLMGANRERVSPDDLRHLVRRWETGGMPSTFYAERTDTTRQLGFARLDVGGHGRWDRILATLAADIRTFESEPTVQPLRAARAFGVTLVTVTLEKAERLRTTFVEKQVTTIPVHFVAVPRLLTLAGPIRAPPR